MSLEIAESDWKKLRELHKLALERFCKQTLNEIHELTSTDPLSYHTLYLRVFKLIESHDKKLGQIFDDLKRSTAFLHLVDYRTRSLITDQEFATLSPETQERITCFISISRA